MNKYNETNLCYYSVTNEQSITLSGYLANCDMCNNYEFNLTVFIISPLDVKFHNFGGTFCPNVKCCSFISDKQYNCIFCNKHKIFNSGISNGVICMKCVNTIIEKNKLFLLAEWKRRDRIS